VNLGAGGVGDINGVYGSYLDSLGAVAVLMRPDFYTHGSAGDTDGLSLLIDQWHSSLGLPA
jgi:hypothetical protein